MQSMKPFRYLAALGLTVLFAAVSMLAVDVTGRIRGTVTDPSGAVVVNATVTATNTKTGVAYNTKSNTTGSYQILNLPVGTYNLSATAPGFQSFTANGITLNIDQEYVQPVEFHVGQEAQT
ncbi:MAG: carboxypeptidase regulatory-like domain-containing protein, partial [Acidobacteria bacterium]|nr:carboxypeptidase regulatory-like domain-containing protein [Acidobacteriota bacterium]